MAGILAMWPGMRGVVKVGEEASFRLTYGSFHQILSCDTHLNASKEKLTTYHQLFTEC